MPTPSLVRIALRGLCPRCGRASAFDGLVAFTKGCPSCGLDCSSFNVGDGPAAFLTFAVGAIVVGGAVTLQLIAAPSFWVHLLIWPLLSVILVIGGLRVAKAALLASEYRHDAHEGK